MEGTKFHAESCKNIKRIPPQLV